MKITNRETLAKECEKIQRYISSLTNIQVQVTYDFIDISKAYCIDVDIGDKETLFIYSDICEYDYEALISDIKDGLLK